MLKSLQRISFSSIHHTHFSAGPIEVQVFGKLLTHLLSNCVEGLNIENFKNSVNSRNFISVSYQENQFKIMLKKFHLLPVSITIHLKRVKLHVL